MALLVPVSDLTPNSPFHRLVAIETLDKVTLKPELSICQSSFSVTKCI
jgi:hypothetical protein